MVKFINNVEYSFPSKQLYTKMNDNYIEIYLRQQAIRSKVLKEKFLLLNYDIKDLCIEVSSNSKLRTLNTLTCKIFFHKIDQINNCITLLWRGQESTYNINKDLHNFAIVGIKTKTNTLNQKIENFILKVKKQILPKIHHGLADEIRLHTVNKRLYMLPIKVKINSKQFIVGYLPIKSTLFSGKINLEYSEAYYRYPLKKIWADPKKYKEYTIYNF